MAGKNERGFAAMDPEQQREIARRGGRAAHESGNAHEFTSEEAAEAGRKGGEAVSKNREHMAEIGRKGGLAAHHRNAGDSEDGDHHARPAASAKANAPRESARKRAQSHMESPDVSDELTRQDQALEADMSVSEVEQQASLSRGDSDEVRTSGDEGDDDDRDAAGGRRSRQSGRDDLHA